MRNLIHYDDFNKVLISLEDQNHLHEKKIKSSTLHQSPYLHLIKDHVQTSDGQLSERTFVKHPGSVMIVPRLDKDRFVLVKQYRYPAQKVFIEFPAGKLDESEPAIVAAQRELEEETGFASKNLKRLTILYPSIGYSTERMEVFCADDLEPVDSPPLEGEVLDVFSVTSEILEKLIWSHLIEDPKTQLAYFWTKKIKAR